MEAQFLPDGFGFEVEEDLLPCETPFSSNKLLTSRKNTNGTYEFVTYDETGNVEHIILNQLGEETKKFQGEKLTIRLIKDGGLVENEGHSTIPTMLTSIHMLF